MRVLLSDGTSLAARQAATALSLAGHRVEALSPRPLCLCRMTLRVHAVHRVPAIGTDPLGWLTAALEVAARHRAEVLLPVQEQVAVMSLARSRIEAAGLLTAVPDFGALARVQDKVSAFRTLSGLGLPQPPSWVTDGQRLGDWAGELPLFMKNPVGTASAGVRRLATPAELSDLAARLGPGEVLVQQPAAGPLVMVQSVFARGQLVAFHACQRVREGTGGGASAKLGLALPEVREHVSALGTALGWHGALSADVILSPDGPRFIDINPRLVEPASAQLSGVDLTGTLLEVARAGTARPQPPARPGVRTHQLLLAVLGAAQRTGRRRAVLRELGQAATRTGPYRHSAEELTPWRPADPIAPLPVAAAALATLVAPGSWRYFTGGATAAYALTPQAWSDLLSQARMTPA